MLSGTGNHMVDCMEVDKFYECEECNGSGRVTKLYPMGSVGMECQECGGKGYYERWS